MYLNIYNQQGTGWVTDKEELSLHMQSVNIKIEGGGAMHQICLIPNIYFTAKVFILLVSDILKWVSYS